MNGWIKMHRGLLDWQWYQDGNVTRVFLHLLLTARFEDGHSAGIPVLRGQIVTGRRKLASEIGLSEKEIRNALDKLEGTGEIRRVRASKYSTITICNYGKYQEQDSADGPAEGPAKGQQRATNKERKKEKNLSYDDDPRFLEFWQRYPRRENKPSAFKAWQKQGCGNGLFDEVMVGLDKYLSGPWKDKDKQFIPHPSSWLNGQRWNDEIDVSQNQEDDGWIY